MPIQPTDSSSAEFTTFMRAYQDMVFSTAARLVGNDAQAEDVAQDVFVRAYENFGDLRSSPTAGGWLKTVSTNLSLNYLSRHRKRWRLFSELRHTDEDGDSDADIEWQAPDTLLADLDAEQRRALIDAALRRLPDNQRVPLVLFHFDEASYQEIATRLRISLPKVKTDINRARSALLGILRRAGTSAP